MLAITFVVVSALLRPPASRADQATTPKRVKTSERGKLHAGVLALARSNAPKTSFMARQLARVRAKRHLAAVKMRERVVFRHEVVDYAKKLIGTPYSYGGTSPRSGFDCSGFVRYVFSHFGVNLPHSSFSDIVLGRSVSRGDLLPGDLVFFDGAGHVGIYIGHDEFIHAPHTGTVVRIESMSGWYAGRYDGARRVSY